MRALEFKTKIENNQIQIPKGIQSVLQTNKDKNVRVIVLIDDDDETIFREATTNQFLNGYSDSDSVYDNY
jgi:hypothetical protein